MPAVLCTRYWLDAQGCDVLENIVFQDNESAIILKNNVNTSSSKRKNHINIRYYFVRGRIETGNLSLE